MGRNLFASALAGGLSGYAQGRAQELTAQQEAKRRLEERMAMAELQQDNFMERRAAMGVAGSPGGARGGKIPPAPFDEAEANRRLNYATRSETDAELSAAMPDAPKRADPAYSAAPVMDPRDAQANVQYGPDGERLADGQKPPMVIDREHPLVKQRIAERDRIRKLMAGVDADDYEKLRGGDLVERAAGGDRGAAEGVLLSKGKDPLETAARAEAQEAKADKDKRTDPNIRRTGGGGGGARTPDPLRSMKEERVALDADLGRIERRINSLTSAMKDQNREERSNTQAQIDLLRQHSQQVQQRKDAVVARIGGGGAPAPAQSPAIPPAERRSQFTVVR